MITQGDMSDCVFLINDFGAFNIDAELISAQGVSTLELKNGCICCSMADGLSIALLKIIRGQSIPKRIIIEASGVANPEKIRDLVTLSRSLELDQILVLADASRIQDNAQSRMVGDVVLQQLKCATIVILNKVDIVENSNLNEIEKWLRIISPKSKLVRSEFAKIPTEYFFSNHRPQIKHDAGLSRLKINDGSDNFPTDFQSWSYQSDYSFDRKRLSQLLDALPLSIYRIKGFLKLSECCKQMYLLQWVEGTWSLSKSEVHPSGVTIVALNVIGSAEFSVRWLETQFKKAKA